MVIVRCSGRGFVIGCCIFVEDDEVEEVVAVEEETEEKFKKAAVVVSLSEFTLKLFKEEPKLVSN